MCGINGFVTEHKRESSDEEVIRKIGLMNNQIIHRGPDDNGYFIDKSNSNNIALGMQRLSIIDLNTGKQPIYSKDKNQIIVFNGEIYNYKILRKELENKGLKFETESDTEVILQIYKEYGVAGFRKLDGMFAFAIYDKNLDKIFIARDFFGEKPLYYLKNDTEFYWASELKSILKVYKEKPPICKKGLNLFFRLTYIPAPFTIYKGISKLRPNHFMVYDLKTKSLNTEVIETLKTYKKENISFGNAKLKVKELVQSSVESRSVSDVPIGTFLSGGVDSSVVSLCLSRMNDQKINTFSIGFEKKGFDESAKSRTVAKLIGSHHHEFILKEDDLKTNIHEIITNFDEPFADSSALPSYLVAQKTSEHVKVALTGDGGDEVFGGYNKYYMGKINNSYTKWVPQPLHHTILKRLTPLLHSKTDKRGKRFKMNRLLNAIDYSHQHYWDIISLGFSSDSLVPYLKPEYLELDIFNHFREQTQIFAPKTLSDYREVDRHISLEGDMLVKVDRTSMLCSLECRAPFLNRSLWEFTSSLPESFLMKGWNKKYILKEAFKEDFPNGFLEKSKAGFGVPIGDWLRSSLRTELQLFASKDHLVSQGIFNPENTMKLINEHLNGKDHTFKVWSFYCFQKWYSTIYYPH